MTGYDLLQTLFASLNLSGCTLAFFALASTTLRMRCLSSPYLCIMAAAAVANFDLYNWIAVKLADVRNRNIVNLLRHIVVAFTIVVLFLTKKENIYGVLCCSSTTSVIV